jgi:peptidyl-prolyl cis-trans isomerase D
MVFTLPEHATEQQVAAARALAQNAFDRVKSGAKFADVTAAAIAASPAGPGQVAATGGSIGWVDPDTIDAAWEPVVFGMSKGEVRGPIQGKGSFRLFHADDVQITPMKPYADMKAELTKQIKEKELVKLTQAWLVELRKKAHVEIKI